MDTTQTIALIAAIRMPAHAEIESAVKEARKILREASFQATHNYPEVTVKSLNAREDEE
jgi:hypothetical protein